MDPREARAALVEEIQDGLALVASDYPIEELSRTLDELSRYFQAFAICHLLESEDTTKYRDNLARSAFARRYFLRKSREAGNTQDRYLALSRNEAFLDALAAGHSVLARDIATLSGDAWHQTWEYGDDFYYFLFLHRVVSDPMLLGGSESLALLDQYEEQVDGGPPGRGRVLRSLVERNEPAFGDGLSVLMQERDEELQARSARLSEPDVAAYTHWPRTFVCIEGLALIAIGALFGLRAPVDLPLCQPIARLNTALRAVDDPFLGIEAELRRAGG